jgi:CheY-like chemotaxis protein
MSRILLVDDSPHAQRMGERILSDEGYEVVTVSNADSALIRLDDVDPDVVLADTVMPGHTGYEICQYLKMSPRHRHVRVILTAGVLEVFDEERARRAEADGTLKKPFEASALLAAVKPLAEAALRDRAAAEAVPGATGPAAAEAKAEVPFVTVVDSEHVHAAVTVALDAAMESIADEISRRVLAALRVGNAESLVAEVRAAESGVGERPAPQASDALESAALGPVRQVTPRPSDAPWPATPIEPVRRVTPLRIRTGSILGLDISGPEPPTPHSE